MKFPNQEQRLRAKLHIQGSRLFSPGIIYRHTTQADRQGMLDALVRETLEVKDPTKVALGANREAPTSEDVAFYTWVTTQPREGLSYLNGFDLARPLAALAFDGFDRFEKKERAERMVQAVGGSATKLADALGADFDAPPTPPLVNEHPQLPPADQTPEA